jgi:hypothetical protein
MGKIIAVAGRTLTQSNATPDTVIFTIVETDVPAARTNGGAHPLLIDRISLACTCSGNFSPTQTYAGSGNAQIVAKRQRVSCEGKPLLLVGDQVTITCSGTARDTASGTPVPANASVTVTITAGNQPTILANEA